MKHNFVRIYCGLAAIAISLLLAGSISAASNAAPAPTPAAWPDRLTSSTPDSPPSWNTSTTKSNQVVIANDQSRAVPNPDDEVHLIVLLADEPLAAYLHRSVSPAQPWSAATLAATQRYSDQLAAAHRAVLAQIAQRGIPVKVNREFSYLVNGLALSARMRDWPRLKELPQVKAVQLDDKVHADLSDSVPLIGAPQVWSLHDGNGHSVNGQGLRVAIIDTGIDYTHPDLGNGFGPSHRVIGGYDFVNNDNDPMDDNGHGTHVAGIVAANGGVVGVAPGANLLAYKALDANGSGSFSNVIAAIERATDPDGNPATADAANVINMSLTGPGNPDDAVSQAVDNAVDQGVIVVVAAGNSGPGYETMGTPASARKALTVAASDKSDQLASFSSRGPMRDYLGLLKPDITAPGVSIRSTVPLNGQWGSADRYNTLSGTSMAAPHIAGAAALIKQLHPTWTPDMIKANLMNTAKDLSQNAYVQGAGRVRVNVAATTPLIAVPGTISFGQPFMGGATSAQLTLRNIGTTTLTATASLSTLQWDNGTLSGSPISIPVTYTQLTETNVLIPAGGTHVITVNLNIPDNAPDGYYLGQIVLRGANYTVTVPFAFSLLSKVTVHLLDEQGVEYTNSAWWWYGDYWSYLVRVPEADVQMNSWAVPDWAWKAPTTYYVPSGTYDAFGFGRTMSYAHVLKSWGGPPQIPLLLAATVNVPRHAALDVYLDGRAAHRFTLDTTTFEGDPLFIEQWDAGFKYQNGDKQSLAHLGWAYGELLSGDLSAPLPPSLDFYISDTPANVSFDFATTGFGYTPALHHFEQFNWLTWYDADYPGVTPGFGFRTWSDEAHLFAWHFPQIAASTPTSLRYNRSDVGRYAVINDIPGTADSPMYPNAFWSGVDFIEYPLFGVYPWGAASTVGLRRDVYVAGAFHYRHWSDQANLTTHSFYTPDLQPLSPVDVELRIGGGPLYPAITFDNDPAAKAIQLSLPVLGSSYGNRVIWNWGGSAPQLSLYRNGLWVYGSGLDEQHELSPTYSIPIDQAGAYRLLIEATNNAQVAYHNTIEAGFTLSSAVTDVNPPRVIALDMPQRFTPLQPITATFTLTDAESGINSFQLRSSTDDGAHWASLPVTHAGSRYTVVIDPDDALQVSLNFTATDNANNYLAFTSIGSALRETPVVFDVNASPAVVPFQPYSTTLHLTGVLRKPDGQPLSQIAFPIAVYFDDQFAGYVRDLVGQTSGAFQHGTIDTDWTFVPTDFFTTTGPAKMKFVLDVGTYARQEKVIDLSVAEIHRVYLPLIQATNDLIVNGGFETDQAWIFEGEPSMSVYTGVAHSGQRGMKLGILSSEPHVYGYGLVKQLITIPSGVPAARLSFWYWPLREDGSEPLLNSRQFVKVLDSDGQVLETLLETSQDGDWRYVTFDLTHYAGRSIYLQFGVFNDGNLLRSKRTAMVVDDVSLLLSTSTAPVSGLDGLLSLPGRHSGSGAQRR
jgi:subtilisin family serine protease